MFPPVAAAANLDLNNIINKLFGVAIIGGGLWLGKKAWDNHVANKASDKVGSDPNSQAATEIRQAVEGAGTSETQLWQIAAHISDWTKVSEKYRELYPGRNMLEDIKNDLSPEEYAKFLNIYNLSKTDDKGQLVNGKNKVEKGMWIFLEKQSNIRKSPHIPGVLEKAKNLGKDNIIALAPAGKYLGVATGKYSIDTSTDQSTLFLEVTIGVVDANNKSEKLTAWVASSQVITKPATDKPGKNLQIFKKTDYQNALGFIGANTNTPSELVLKGGTAPIYDQDGHLMGSARGTNLILGQKTGEYSKDNKRFFIFQNIQGLIRMIEVDKVTERRAA